MRRFILLFALASGSSSAIAFPTGSPELGEAEYNAIMQFYFGDFEDRMIAPPSQISLHTDATRAEFFRSTDGRCSEPRSTAKSPL